MMWAGVMVNLICLGIAALNTEFLNYWLALVLLGIGWNFLFLSGTNLLPLVLGFSIMLCFIRETHIRVEVLEQS